MKMLTLIATLVLSAQAFATSKVCFGSTKDDQTKGVEMTAEVLDSKIVLKTTKGDSYDGTYPALAGVVHAHTGEEYVQYEGESGDQQDIILVDSQLLKVGTQGLLQIRSRGEGFFNSVFFCKDAK